MKVYTAGPLGFSEAGRVVHERIVETLQHQGYKVLDPWTYSPEDIRRVLDMPYGSQRKTAWERLNPLIGKLTNRSSMNQT